MNNAIAISTLKLKLKELGWSVFSGFMFGCGLCFGFWLLGKIL